MQECVSHLEGHLGSLDGGEGGGLGIGVKSPIVAWVSSRDQGG